MQKRHQRVRHRLAGLFNAGVFLLVYGLLAGLLFGLKRCAETRPPVAAKVKPSTPCYGHQDILADGWPAYGWAGPVSGKGLPSLNLFLDMGGPQVAVDSMVRVYVVYRVKRYNPDADTYRLGCNSVNALGDTLPGIWPGVCHDALFGAMASHPLTGTQMGFSSREPAGARWQPKSVLFLPGLLDLRTGELVFHRELERPGYRTGITSLENAAGGKNNPGLNRNIKQHSFPILAGYK